MHGQSLLSWKHWVPLSGQAETSASDGKGGRAPTTLHPPFKNNWTIIIFLGCHLTLEQSILGHLDTSQAIFEA